MHKQPEAFVTYLGAKENQVAVWEGVAPQTIVDLLGTLDGGYQAFLDGRYQLGNLLCQKHAAARLDLRRRQIACSEKGVQPHSAPEVIAVNNDAPTMQAQCIAKIFPDLAGTRKRDNVRH
ncbi:MAG: hypothetical protein WDN31_02525, partial [Hyphomicrobium sp.]